MAYIGNTPALQYITHAKQTLTADSSTVAFTLSNAVANENELEVFVNNVRQEPGSGKAYTASGTTLTMSEAPNTGDSFYCIYQGKATQTVTPGASTVTNDMLSGSIANAKLANSSITLNSSAISLGGSHTLANSPNFHAVGATQNLTNTTWTKITATTERFDNGSAYDASNSKFVVPSGGAGVYFFSALYRMENDSGSSFCKFYKNGSALNDWVSEDHGSAYFSVHQNILVNLAESDYIEMYGYINVGNTNGITNISFQGYKLV